MSVRDCQPISRLPLDSYPSVASYEMPFQLYYISIRVDYIFISLGPSNGDNPTHTVGMIIPTTGIQIRCQSTTLIYCGLADSTYSPTFFLNSTVLTQSVNLILQMLRSACISTAYILLACSSLHVQVSLPYWNQRGITYGQSHPLAHMVTANSLPDQI